MMEQQSHMEFRVNIYPQHYSSAWPIVRQIANYFYSYNVDDPLKKRTYSLPGYTPAYRIHVKLKPVKSSVIRATYHKSFDKFNWMN